MRRSAIMKITPTRLAGVLALVLVVACDGGGAPEGKTAAPAKTEPAKTEPTAVLEPAPTEPAKVEPTPAEPSPSVVVPTPSEPSRVAEPTIPSDVVAEPDEPDEPDEPAVAAHEGTTPISLGPNAELLALVLARDVVNRQPVDPGTSFPSGTKVNLFIESRNESEADIPLTITWENVASGRRTPPVPVTIPVRKLNRSRAYRTLKLSGAHRCILIDESGNEIAVLPFTIE
jgi:hypothetical protein